MGQDQGLIALIISSKALSEGDQLAGRAGDGALSSHVVVACLGGAIDVPTTLRISTSSPGLELARCSAASLTASRSLKVFSEPTLEM